MAQFFSFSCFFFLQPLLSSLSILRFVISGPALGHGLSGNFFFPGSSQDGRLLASSFTLPPLHLGLGPLSGKGFYLYGLFCPSLGSMFLRHHEIKNLTRNKCHVSVYWMNAWMNELERNIRSMWALARAKFEFSKRKLRSLEAPPSPHPSPLKNFKKVLQPTLLTLSAF